MDANYLDQLEQQLRSPALNERKIALDALAQTPSDLAVPILQRLTQDVDFLQRRFGVMGLGNHTTDESYAVLQHLLATEPDANVLAEVANSLFEFGEVSLPILTDLFQHNEHWLLRQTILGILADANRPEILLSVIRVGLTDTTETTRETAILALGALVNGDHQDEAVSLLLEMAGSSEWRDRWRAAIALTPAADPRAKAMLAQLREDANHYVVAAALESTY
jgi:HEAT repeat protein